MGFKISLKLLAIALISCLVASSLNDLIVPEANFAEDEMEVVAENNHAQQEPLSNREALTLGVLAKELDRDKTTTALWVEKPIVELQSSTVLACGKEWPTAEFKAEWDGYCSGTGAPAANTQFGPRFSKNRPFEGSQSFALDSKCSVGSPWYSTSTSSGSTNVVSEARSQCKQKHGQTCQTFDVDRNKCFGCFAGGGNFDAPTDVKNSWKEYCKAPGKITFAMSGACGQAAWASGDDANENALIECNAAGSEQCFPFDFNGEKCPVGPGAHDLRQQMPSCLQVEPDWCWATGVTEIARFFGYAAPGMAVDTAFLNASAYTDNHCGGLECLVVGHMKNAADPTACCSDRSNCATDGGTDQNEVDGISHLVGQQYAAYYPVSLRTTQSILDKTFAAHKPAIMNVGWICPNSDFDPTTDYPLKWYESCGGHAVTLAGMDGMGRYYLHDPLNRVNNYQALTMAELLTYSAPEFNYNGSPTSFIIPLEFSP